MSQWILCFEFPSCSASVTIGSFIEAYQRVGISFTILHTGLKVIIKSKECHEEIDHSVSGIVFGRFVVNIKKGYRGVAAQEQEIIFLELNQEGLVETKSSHICIFMFYIFWDLEFLQTQLRRAKNCHSVILTKPFYFSLQIAVSGQHCWVWTTMPILRYIGVFWMTLSVQLLYLLSCCSVTKRDCH